MIKNEINELSWKDVRRFVKDELQHTLVWDGKDIWVDGKFCKL